MKDKIEQDSSAKEKFDLSVSITSSVPVVQQISPKTGEPGDRFTATISGDVFTNVNQCSLGADIEVKNLNIIGDGTVAVKLTIADGAKKGLRDVKLTSPTGTGVLKNGFEVL